MSEYKSTKMRSERGIKVLHLLQTEPDMSYAEIGRLVGMTRAGVHAIAKADGFVGGRARSVSSRLPPVVEMAKTGMPPQTIMERCGVTRTFLKFHRVKALTLLDFRGTIIRELEKTGWGYCNRCQSVLPLTEMTRMSASQRVCKACNRLRCSLVDKPLKAYVLKLLEERKRISEHGLATPLHH